MSSSPFNDWSPGRLYVITLNTPHPEASLHGFRNGRQERYFNNQEEIDGYTGELWLEGLSDVTVKEKVSD